jgi:hypothetical protein
MLCRDRLQSKECDLRHVGSPHFLRRLAGGARSPAALETGRHACRLGLCRRARTPLAVGCASRPARAKMQAAQLQWYAELAHWSAADDALLGTMPDGAVAKLLGCNRTSARKRRVKLGVPAFLPPARRAYLRPRGVGPAGGKHNSRNTTTRSGADCITTSPTPGRRQQWRPASLLRGRDAGHRVIPTPRGSRGVHARRTNLGYGSRMPRIRDGCVLKPSIVVLDRVARTAAGLGRCGGGVSRRR